MLQEVRLNSNEIHYVKLLAKTHYTKILTDTRLLLLYIDAFGSVSLEDTIEEILKEIKRLDREVKMLDKMEGGGDGARP